MVNRCAVQGCNKTGGLGFPTAPEVNLKWWLAVKRPEWIPSEHSKVCSAHFKPADFKDSIINTCSANPSPKRRYLKLKDGAVPSMFPWSTSQSSSPPCAPISSSPSASTSCLLPSPSLPSTSAAAVMEWTTEQVTVNTPRTMKGRTQLPADVVVEDRKIASKRVHVERVIGLAKHYKILQTKMDHSRTPAGGRIIYVCFALVNFRLNIVPRHC